MEVKDRKETISILVDDRAKALPVPFVGPFIHLRDGGVDPAPEAIELRRARVDVGQVERDARLQRLQCRAFRSHCLRRGGQCSGAPVRSVRGAIPAATGDGQHEGREEQAACDAGPPRIAGPGEPRVR